MASSLRNDPFLDAFLDAVPEGDAWIALEDLLGGEVGALIRNTVVHHLSGARWMNDHIDDVLAELRLKLTQKLWSLRAGQGEPIENFHAYSTIAAERTCYSFLRRQFPERSRLRNRVRYALTHHPETTLEQDVVGIWRCRSAATRLAPAAGSTQSLLDAPRRFAFDRGLDLRAPLPHLVAAIVASCDQPVEFDRLVDAIATMLGVSDAPPPSRDSTPGSDPLERVADPATTIGTLLEQRASVDEVWREILALPIRQRHALLLNLREPATSVVSSADLAAALEMTDSELAALWNDLPLDDHAIAHRLGATRQQVINLRKSARARLARRLGRSRP